jgi:hypothetical protein
MKLIIGILMKWLLVNANGHFKARQLVDYGHCEIVCIVVA